MKGDIVVVKGWTQEQKDKISTRVKEMLKKAKEMRQKAREVAKALRDKARALRALAKQHTGQARRQLFQQARDLREQAERVLRQVAALTPKFRHLLAQRTRTGAKKLSPAKLFAHWNKAYADLIRHGQRLRGVVRDAADTLGRTAKGVFKKVGDAASDAARSTAKKVGDAAKAIPEKLDRAMERRMARQAAVRALKVLGKTRVLFSQAEWRTHMRIELLGFGVSDKAQADARRWAARRLKRYGVKRERSVLSGRWEYVGKASVRSQRRLYHELGRLQRARTPRRDPSDRAINRAAADQRLTNPDRVDELRRLARTRNLAAIDGDDLLPKARALVDLLGRTRSHYLFRPRVYVGLPERQRVLSPEGRHPLYYDRKARFVDLAELADRLTKRGQLRSITQGLLRDGHRGIDAGLRRAELIRKEAIRLRKRDVVFVARFAMDRDPASAARVARAVRKANARLIIVNQDPVELNQQIAAERRRRRERGWDRW